MMRYTNKAEAKAAAEPNSSALQHAGLVAVLMLVILFSLVEMARTIISHPTNVTEIVSLN